jgi:uncharacterized protein (DUF2164 family)
MGCDYFIDTLLEIKLNNDSETFTIFIYREKGYYYYNCYDSDNEDYEIKKNENKEICLTTIKPIKIFIDNNFINEKLKNKYYNLIYDEINKRNLNFNHIISVYKIEDRYERD